MNYDPKTNIKLLYFEVVALTPPIDSSERKGFKECQDKVLKIIERHIKEDSK